MVARIAAEFSVPGNGYAGGCVRASVALAVSQDWDSVEVDVVLNDLLAGCLVDRPEWFGALYGVQHPSEQLVRSHPDGPCQQHSRTTDAYRDSVLPGLLDVLEEEGLGIKLVRQSGNLVLRRDLPLHVRQVTGLVQLSEETSQVYSNLATLSRLENAGRFLI